MHRELASIVGRTSPAAHTQSHSYRPDIDGLRAIAVASVVLYHAGLPHLTSGFIGVDIFFAISGYLIGGIIYSEVVESRFSFAEFYARRARRILPALLVVALFTCILGMFLLTSEELTSTAKQTLTALGGFSNIQFWLDTDYFAEDSELKPLLMTWSLGVEEQFYLFFPFAIFLIARLRYRYRLLTLGAACFGSSALSLILLHVSPTAAFYLLPPRAWEMGAGAILAILHRMRPAYREGAWARSDIVAGSGLTILAGSTFLLKDLDFPGWAATFPILGTILLLSTQNSLINRAILGNRIPVYVGLVSYSWYLWHWPLMSYVRIVSVVPPSLLQMLVVALISFILAMASRRFVEQPFRMTHAPAPQILRKYGMTMAACAGAPALLLILGGIPGRLASAALTGEAVAKEGRSVECLASFKDAEPLTTPACAPEGASVALFGDSHAAAISPGLVQAAKSQNISVRQFTKSACSPIVGYTNYLAVRPAHMAACSEFVEATAKAIVSDPAIRTVAITGNFADFRLGQFRKSDDPDHHIPSAEAWADGLGSTIDRFKAAGKRVIVVGDVPRFSFNPYRLFMTQEIPARRWASHQLQNMPALAAGRLAMVDLRPGYAEASQYIRQVALSHGAEWFDPTEQLCQTATCAIRDGDVPLYFDEHHLSAAGALTIDWPIL